MRTQRPLAAVGAVYNEASGVYWQAFGPLIVVAGAIALAFNIPVTLISPTGLLYSAVGGLLVNFVGVTLLASAFLVPMISETRALNRSPSALPTDAVREHGWHVAATAFILILANAVLVLTFIGIALAVFLTVRLAFVSVAALAEDTDITDSLARSWEVTAGVWTRTAGVLVGAAAPIVALFVVLAVLNWPWLARVVVTSIGEALVVPFVATVLTIVFDEYRAFHPEPEDFGTNRRPPL